MDIILPPGFWKLPLWFAETTLVAGALAAAAWLGSRSGRLGPSARHALWLVVLVRLVVPPVVHWPWARGMETSPASVRVSPSEELPPEDKGSPGATIEARSLAPLPAPLTPESIARIDTTREPDPDSPPALHHPSESVAPEPPSTIRFEVEAVPEGGALRLVGVGLLTAWLLGSLAIAALQASRILAFRRRLGPGSAVPAPSWLTAETARMADLLRVRPPTVWIVPGLTTPMLWCLGRPRLLVPEHLLAELDGSCWRSILAHELAHLRRGDQWVSRLELAAGLAWWWNPIYWLVRGRIDAEAELACDAWVVSLLPDDRLTYADSLFQLCSQLSPRSSTEVRVPALGVTGSGRFFEKRLTMILKETASCRRSAWSTLAATLLMVASAPAWTLAEPPETASVEAVVEEQDAIDAEPAEKPAAPVPPVPPVPPTAPSATTITSAGGDVVFKGPDGKMIRAKQIKLLKDKQEKAKAADLDVDGEAIAEKMEAIVEKIVEKAFGPEFEKKMEALGKDMEKKYGPGSDFEKMMEKMGKDLEKQLGPGSEFERTIKAQVEKVKAEASRAAMATRSLGQAARPENTARTAPLAKLDPKPFKAEATGPKDGKSDPAKIEIPAHSSDAPKVAADDKARAEVEKHAKEDKAKAEKLAKEDKARAEAERAKAREEHARAMIERKAAQALANEERAVSARERDRTRRIMLLEAKLRGLMEELKQLESEDRPASGRETVPHPF